MTAPKIDLHPQPRPQCDHRFGRWVENVYVDHGDLRQSGQTWSRVCRECGMVETTTKKPRRKK